MSDELHNKRGGKATKLETGDTRAIMELVTTSIRKRGGRPSYYPDTEEGLLLFKDETLKYFEYVEITNNDPAIERKLIPDIESWAAFLGTQRQTLWEYSQRNQEWYELIQYYKDCILAIKKQCALYGKIPPVLAIFDMVNNHGYLNTSTINTEMKLEYEKQKDNYDMPDLSALLPKKNWKEIPPLNTDDEE